MFTYTLVKIKMYKVSLTPSPLHKHWPCCIYPDMEYFLSNFPPFQWKIVAFLVLSRGNGHVNHLCFLSFILLPTRDKGGEKPQAKAALDYALLAIFLSQSSILILPEWPCRQNKIV